MSKRAELVKELEQQLVKFDANLKRKRIAIKEAGAHAKVELKHKLAELEQLKREADEKLHALRESSEENLHEVESKARQLWDSLGRELHAYDPEE